MVSDFGKNPDFERVEQSGPELVNESSVGPRGFALKDLSRTAHQAVSDDPAGPFGFCFLKAFVFSHHIRHGFCQCIGCGGAAFEISAQRD